MNHLKDFVPVDSRSAPFEGLLRPVGSMTALCIVFFLVLLFLV